MNRKVPLSVAATVLLLGASPSHAQSSVTLYGILDDSVRYVSNTGGHSLIGMGASNLNGNRWGLRGVEDLGGGLSAVFTMENGFNPNTGALGQGGRMFGRQVFVGLLSRDMGKITLGRQYDPIVDMVSGLTAEALGAHFVTPGDLDDIDGSARANNSVKYVSPVFAGLQFEGMYAFGGVAGASGAGQAWSAAASYALGSLKVGAAYYQMNNPLPTTTVLRTGWAGATDGTFDGGSQNAGYSTAKFISIASAAVRYIAGTVTFGARYSNARYKPDAQSVFGHTENFNTGGGFVSYQATPATLFSLGYLYTHGSGDTSASYSQVSFLGDYLLSRRTDVYLIGAWQHATGSRRVSSGVVQSAVASVGDYGLNSNSANQTLVALGIRHRF